jgi:hypothetical protein
MRVGNVVTVSGRVDVDPSSAGGANTVLDISLPVASALANQNECAGVAKDASEVDQAGVIEAEATNDRARLRFNSVQTANIAIMFTFSYRVL